VGVTVNMDDGGINHRVFQIGLIGQSLENALENAALRPIPEALEHRVPVAEFRRQITPGTAGARNPQNALEKPAPVHARSAGVCFLAQTKRLDLPPLIRRQNISNHNSRSRFWELESQSRRLVNPDSQQALVFAFISAAAIRFALQSEERAAILAIDTGRARLAEGHTDEALLVLLNAAKQFKDDDAPADLLIAFDEALQRATAETVITLPVGARVFDAPNGYYIYDPATDDLLLLDSAEPPRVVSRAVGRPFFAGDAPDGSLILVKSDFKIERRVNDRVETLGAFSPPADGPTGDQLRLDLQSLQFDKLEMYPISRDGMLEFGRQYFDLDARTLYQVKPLSHTLLQTMYSPAPNGRRVLFGRAIPGFETDPDAEWITSVAPIEAQEKVRTRSEDAFAELMGYRCWGAAQVNPETKRQFAEAIDDIVAIECSHSGSFLLLSVYAQMAGAAVRHDFLLDLPGKGPAIANRDASPRIQHILADRLEDVSHTYVSGAAPEGLLQRQFKDAALRSVTYTEEELEVRFGPKEDRILALASFRDVLVDTPDLRHYWRMPKEALSVRFLSGNLVGVLDALEVREDDPGAIRAVRVLDFSSPHLYASRPYIEDANDQYRGEVANGMSIEIEEFDDKNWGASLYSAEAGRTYRRLGAGYNNCLSAEFRNANEVHLSVDGSETIIRIHSLSEAVAAAKAALAPGCHTFRGNAFRQSACWPAQLAE
jgi:hypothetical protein